MAKVNHQDRLNQALVDLVASQANLLTAQAGLANVQATIEANQAAFQGNLIALERATAERFAHVEVELAEIRAILVRHEQILHDLPEAVRQRIGFERQG
jgi:hypothetical protein